MSDSSGRSHRRPWLAFAAAALVVLVTAISLAIAQGHQQTTSASQPGQAASVGISPAPQPSSQASPSIAQADPVSIRLPKLQWEASVLALPQERSNPIDPPTLGDVYWDRHPVVTATPKDSYAPGTNAPDLVVLAGHTSNLEATAALNPLYNWSEQRNLLNVGDELWVRTTASGDRSLVYRLTAVHTPHKGTGPGSLQDDVSIWGTDADPRPGHLLLIGCLQKATVGEESTSNIVWDFAFDRVVS